MKLTTAFKLSALAVALASTSVMAATLDTSELGNDVWTDPRAPQVGNVDHSAYQYVDVGSKTVDKGLKEEGSKNKLTEWYELDGKHYLKITDIAAGADSYEIFEIKADNASIDGKLQQQIIDELNTGTLGQPPLQFTDLGLLDKATAEQLNKDIVSGKQGTLKTILAGLTKETIYTQEKVSDIKRLDSEYLEYADSTRVDKFIEKAVGNLTDDNKDQSLVLANVATANEFTGATLTDRGVINGILNGKSNPAIADRKYGLSVHAKKTEIAVDGSETVVEEKSTVITENDIVVSSKTADKDINTTITAEGITTGKLTVDGVDVGTALGNVAALGNLNKDQLDAIVNGGQKISALETGLSDLDTKVDTEVARLDGRIDAELTANATASTAYTDQKATETLAAANTYTDTTATTLRGEFAAGDAATLATARTEIAAGDAATLTAANAYTDQAVQGFNSRVNQLNQRVNDVEKTAYRGIAIALAAQQQIPNIGAGQMAVFGGVGHYEGESAAALGLASVLADGRTSVSAALGFAGGSEIGGRVGVAYVFGGK